MHSILIVGCGSIGERHLRCFLKTGRARVTGCDTSEPLREAMGERYGVETFAEYDEALAQEVDAVVICTPAHLHIPMALTALRAGKHVLIEKPLSTTLDEVDALVKTHEESGREVAVAYVQHVFPFLAEARGFLRKGELGPIRHVSLTSGHHFPSGRPAHAAPYAQTYYRDRRTGGGAIQDALTHMANWVESVIGPTDSVLCDCAHQSLPDVEVEDTVNVSARNGDVLVSYSLNQFQAANETTLLFHGVKGSVKIEYHRQRWGVLRLGEAEWRWHASAVAERDRHFLDQAHAFLDQVEGQPPRLCSLDAAVHTLRFNLAALASAESHCRVRCGDLVLKAPPAATGE